MSKYRHSSRRISVQCEGDAYIDDFETEVLVEELKRRKSEEKPDGTPKVQGPDDDLILVYETLRDGRIDEAVLLIEKYLWPKWKTVEACEADLRALTIKPIGEALTPSGRVNFRAVSAARDLE